MGTTRYCPHCGQFMDPVTRTRIAVLKAWSRNEISYIDALRKLQRLGLTQDYAARLLIEEPS